MPEPSPKSKKAVGQGFLAIVATLVLIAIIGALSDDNDKAALDQTNQVLASASPLSGDGITPVVEETADTEPGVALSGAQANAARSAQQYLDMTGFSRQGLIDQLV